MSREQYWTLHQIWLLVIEKHRVVLSFNLLIMFTATNSFLLSNPFIECSYPTSFQLRSMFYLEISHSIRLCKVIGPLLTTFLTTFIYFRVSNLYKRCESLITSTLVHWFAYRKFVCGLNCRIIESTINWVGWSTSGADFNLGKRGF